MKELISMIGKRGQVASGVWTLTVEVTDVKKVYGIEKLLVIQVGLESAHWINRDSFKEIV